MTANKKNRVENGARAVLIGSNPHSNGDVFSRSFDDRIDIKVADIISKLEIIKHVIDDIINIFIN